MTALAARALLILLAALCAVVAVTGLRSDDRCRQARTAVLHGSHTTAAARTVADRCGDPRDRAFAAALMAQKGHAAPARQLARRMVRDSPQDYLGWLALGRLTNDQRALARAHALNPRGVPPPARRR